MTEVQEVGAGPAGLHSRCGREADSPSEVGAEARATPGRGTGGPSGPRRAATRRPRWTRQRSWRPWRRTGRQPRPWPGQPRTEDGHKLVWETIKYYLSKPAPLQIEDDPS